MNSDERFIQQIESYLDDHEGATILPERVRDEVRAALPRTKQTGAASGPVRYLSMAMTKFAPVALAAAAGLLAIAVGIYLFGGRDVGTIGPTPSPSPSAAATCTQSSLAASDGRLVVDWCSLRSEGASVPVAFSMDGPPSWIDEYYSDPDALWLRPPGGGAILFAVHPGRTVDEVLEDVRGRDGYAVSNEADVDLDGATGVSFDLTLAEGASAGDTEPLFSTSQQSWALSEGAQRVWIVDRDGETLIIAAGEQLVDAVTESLSTLTWGD